MASTTTDIINGVAKSKIQSIASLIILVTSLTPLLWGFWPLAYATRSLTILPENLQLSVPNSTHFASPSLPSATGTAIPSPQTVAAQSAIPANRLLNLVWLPVIRAGDAQIIRLTLETGELVSLTPSAAFEGNLTAGQTVDSPGVFETHKVIAEARLDISGLQIVPMGIVSQALHPDQSVLLFWSVRPTTPGAYQGTLWFYLRYVPLAGELSDSSQPVMPESEQAIAALPLKIEAISFLGLKARAARLLGAGGALLGIVLGIPSLLRLLERIGQYVKSRNTIL